VSVFARTSSGQWALEARLTSIRPRPRERFGSDLALAGDRLAVSAAGAIHLFERTATGWAPETVLPLPRSDRAFVLAFVALDDSRLVVSGLPNGVAYVFARTPQGWTLDALLTASSGDVLGRCSVDGDRIAAGAPRADRLVGGHEEGAAFLFERTGGAWAQTAQLTSDDPTLSWGFGWEVALSGDTLAVSAPVDSFGVPGGGTVHVFEHVGGAWPLAAKLDGGSDGELALGVLDLEGDCAVMGMITQGNVDAARVYERAGSAWSGSSLAAPVAYPQSEGFGFSVALSADGLVVGSIGSDPVAKPVGTAYAFALR
jgi:hypothetical protein